MSEARSFAPVADVSANTLILGSMPGIRSLDLQQYYGHPQNAFWRIMGELVGATPELPYANRLIALKQSKIALWDVLQFCERPGSLDSAIVNKSVVPNDFAAFFAHHCQIDRVFFNGAKAEEMFSRHVLHKLNKNLLQQQYQRLPSTSPAHASMSFAEKLACWSVLKRD
jgi:TDG/mug DNA glycosylase family protein